MVPGRSVDISQFVARPQETDMPVSEAVVAASAVLELPPESVHAGIIPMPVSQIGHVPDPRENDFDYRERRASALQRKSITSDEFLNEPAFFPPGA